LLADVRSNASQEEIDKMKAKFGVSGKEGGDSKTKA
jgi:hypothetical protein